MKNLTWQNPEQLFVAQELINKVKSKCCGIKDYNKGSMATIGRNNAVVELQKIRFSGFPAWAVWLFIHLMSIVGVKNRLFIFIDWMWSYFTYDPSLRLIIKPQPSKEETENKSNDK